MIDKKYFLFMFIHLTKLSKICKFYAVFIRYLGII